MNLGFSRYVRRSKSSKRSASLLCHSVMSSSDKLSLFNNLYRSLEFQSDILGQSVSKTHVGMHFTSISKFGTIY